MSEAGLDNLLFRLENPYTDVKNDSILNCFVIEVIFDIHTSFRSILSEYIIQTLKKKKTE